MMRAMSTSASGMRAQQIYVDAIANNLANVNTTAFKRGRVEFQDLLYETLSPNQSSKASADLRPVQVGHGVRLAAIRRNFSQGATQITGNALDMVISGDGFFRIEMPDGSYAYSRDGSFTVDAEGSIVTSGGLKLAPGITIPEDTSEVAVDREGKILVRLAGEEDAEEVGQIELFRFVNPAGMKSLGNNLYGKTEASGESQVGIAGLEGFGSIDSGMLEGSNVSVVEEMIRLIEAQRAYELNSKAITTSEDMLSVANQLKR